MRFVSREEELEQQLLEMAEEYGERKWKRVKKTFFVLCGVICFVLLYRFLDNGGISNINISDVSIGDILCSLVGLTFGVGFAAGMIMFVSYGILFYIINESLKEEKAISRKAGELEAIKFSKYNKE